MSLETKSDAYLFSFSGHVQKTSSLNMDSNMKIWELPFLVNMMKLRLPTQFTILGRDFIVIWDEPWNIFLKNYFKVTMASPLATEIIQQ